MKVAVIVVGSHWSGKSMTINKYFKPLVGISGRKRSFDSGRVLSQSQEEKEGRVLSQSLEEKELESVNGFISTYSKFKYIVCAARPEYETPSFYLSLKSGLEDSGFTVYTVRITKTKDKAIYEAKAKEIYQYLQLV